MTEQNQGMTYIVLGWIFFAISLILIPILFGAGAFIMGFLTHHGGNKVHGMILMVFSIVGIVFGTILGFIVGMA